MSDIKDSKQEGSFITGVLTGGVLGFFLATLLLSVAGYSWIQRKVVEAKRGWNLVPVVVAAQDIPEGSVVTFDVISQRSVPEQFVTSSVVKPDSASYVVNHRVLVPLQAGDMLLWSQFESEKAKGSAAPVSDANTP